MTPAAKSRLAFAAIVAVLGAVALGAALMLTASSTSDEPGVKDGSAGMCAIDVRTLGTAEAAYFKNTGQFGTVEQLAAAGLLPAPPELHRITVGSASSYVVRVNDTRCGVPGHAVGQTSVDR